MKKAILIILIILVILIGAPLCYLFLSGGEYDDPSLLVSPDTLVPSERYTINAKSKVINVLFSKGDIVYIINEELGDDIFTFVNEYLSGIDISLQKAGFHIENDRISASARLIFKRFLPLPVRITGAIKTEGTHITIIPETAYIGKWIQFSIAKLPFTIDDITYDIRDLHTFLAYADSVAIKEDEISVTAPYPTEWLMDGMESFPSDYTMIVDLVDPEEMDTLLPQFIAYTEGNTDVANQLIDSYADDPGNFADIKRYSMALGTTHATVDYYAGEGNEYIELLFPELTKDSVIALQNNMLSGYRALYDSRINTLSDAFQYLLDGYAADCITVKNKELVYNEKGNPPVVPVSIPALEGTTGWFDIDSARCILATNGGDYTLRQMPKGNMITALIFRTHTQRPVVAYRYTENMFKVKSITEEDYVKMMQSEKTPVYDLGEHTTMRK